MNEITVDFVEGKEMLNVHITSGADAGRQPKQCKSLLHQLSPNG